MRLGASSAVNSGKYAVPARNLMDVIATNDITTLLTLVRGVDPFDHSPGMQLILAKATVRPSSANPLIIYTNEIDADATTIGVFKDADGNTALHLAAGRGLLPIVKVLVEECEADVNARNAEGWTPLLVAARCGQTECVDYLIEWGAEAVVMVWPLETPSNFAAPDLGRSAMFLAHYNGHTATASVLNEAYEELATQLPTVSSSDNALSTSLTSLLQSPDPAAAAFLLDVMDCECAACGPILAAHAPPSRSAVRDALQGGVEDCLIPSGTPMSASQLFFFLALLDRGLFTSGAEEQVVPPEMFEKIVMNGHIVALRLVAERMPRAALEKFVMPFVSPEDDSVEAKALADDARLLLEDVDAQRAYKVANASLHRSPDSKRRRREAWEAKVAAHEKRKQLTETGLTPL